MTRLGLLPVLPCVLSSACAAPEQTQQGVTADTTSDTSTDSACASAGCNAGCNLGFASEVYIFGWDQNRLTTSDPSRAFRVAKANGIRVVRVFLGIEGVVTRWRSDRDGTFAGIRLMLDDAAASGVGLVLS